MPFALDDKMRALLDEPHAAVLATVSRRGQPQATPVWYLLENGHILINTSRGRVKLHNIESNPHVALTVVNPKNMYQFVQIQGRVVRTDHAHGGRDIDRLSVRYTGKPYTYPASDRPEYRVSLWVRPLRASGMGV